ncbi:MAG: Mur ligase domain-containing protein, partial [Synergistaceae bacterium]|nr:Mur ligase domain-containing protein [Synergistaceae bacterium]
MKLGELFDAMRGWAEALENPGGADPDITRVEYDSRRVSKSEHGVIFACVVGENSDGHDFAEKAVEAGAAALLCERRLPVRVPQIVARRARAAMSKAASVVCGNPAGRMKMIGLTGTNGKTTTSYLTRSIIRASGAVAGMIGTIVYDDGESESFADRTTPEGPDIQMALSKMVEKGASHCVMEASSHGLDQGRLEGCLFDRVGFSNLTPEHLEYHDGMERYFEAKRKLFSDYTAPGWLGAVNADDEYGN